MSYRSGSHTVFHHRYKKRHWASPSGKAPDFDSAMRRFESSRPSQISLLADLAVFLAPRRAAMAVVSANKSNGWRKVATTSPSCQVQFDSYGVEHAAFLARFLPLELPLGVARQFANLSPIPVLDVEPRAGDGTGVARRESGRVRR